jgi:hypothetical protein
MDFKMAAAIMQQIRATKLTDLRDDLIELAVRYARMRVDYHLANAQQQSILEPDRTACHNAFISSCDILARNMAQHREDVSWRDQLGQDRKVIGDFACWLHALIGIEAR